MLAGEQETTGQSAPSAGQQPVAQADDEAAPPWSHDTPGYDIGQVIGVGGFCKVRLGTEQGSGRKVALKIVEKNQEHQVGCPVLENLS